MFQEEANVFAEYGVRIIDVPVGAIYRSAAEYAFCAKNSVGRGVVRISAACGVFIGDAILMFRRMRAWRC